MNVPNFATEPFLNTRPVWLVTIGALIVALILGSFNLQVYLESNQELTEQLAHRDQLQGHHKNLGAEVRTSLREMDEVKWRGLGAQVAGLNVVLREHGFSWLGMLDDLERVLPYQIKVISITPNIDDDGTVALGIKGIARNRPSFLELLDNMIEDPHFNNPVPDTEQWPESNQTVEYLFVLKVAYLAEAS